MDNRREKRLYTLSWRSETLQPRRRKTKSHQCVRTFRFRKIDHHSSNHDGKFSTTVLHDDAFIISNKDASSICLEQSYFDKTQDYPLTEPQSKYFVTIQNCGQLDSEGRVVPVTEDIQSGNGRTVKSRFAAMNREYRFSHPVMLFSGL